MSSDRASLLLVPLAWLVLVGATGCPGSLENKDDFLAAAGGGGATGPTTGGQGGSPADDPCDGLITERCATSTCHSPGVTPPDLSYEGRVDRIRDQPARCDDTLLLVNTASPEESLMYTKCTSAPPCGSRMPLTDGPLEDEELACLLAWIETL